MRASKLARAKPKNGKIKRPTDVIAVGIYMQRALHRSLKVAASQKGLTLSQYIIARVLAMGPVQVIGDFEIAPSEGVALPDQLPTTIKLDEKPKGSQ